METPIKHRITGAIILVVLVVVLVPEMLSGPRSPGGSASTQTVELPTSATAPVAPLRSIDIDVTERAPGRASLPQSTTGPGAGAGAGGEATGPTLDNAPSASAPPRTAGVPPPAATVAPRPSPAPAAVAPMATEGTAPRYVVQVGSFASRTTADALAATLRRQGFGATVSVVQAGGRTLHRVRVGPAGERSAAEALRARLRAAGHSGSVVAGP
ncbi:MAG: SPOR domain-containing protein [Steroidobacteraceae bacterium]